MNVCIFERFTGKLKLTRYRIQGKFPENTTGSPGTDRMSAQTVLSGT